MKRFLLLLMGGVLAVSCTAGEGDPEASFAEAGESPAEIRATPAEARGSVGEWPELAASARGFPALRDLDGETLADGEFAQWIENDLLHIALSHRFADGRLVEEQAVFRTTPGLAQETWSWRESRDERLIREFEVDFRAGAAVAEKRDGDAVERWSEDIDIDPGRIFAGFGFTLALKDLRERLVGGEAIELEAVAFTPEPRTVTVELSHGGVEQMRMAERVVRGDRFDIRPQIPWIAELFVDAPDTHIWLTHPAPAEFLRWEGPLLEPDDPVLRVDLLPGGESGPAEPLKEESGGAGDH